MVPATPAPLANRNVSAAAPPARFSIEVNVTSGGPPVPTVPALAAEIAHVRAGWAAVTLRVSFPPPPDTTPDTTAAVANWNVSSAAPPVRFSTEVNVIWPPLTVP